MLTAFLIAAAAIAPGVYAGASQKQEAVKGDHGPCQVIDSKRLTLTMRADGSVEWLGYARSEWRCRSPLDGGGVPQSCWAKGAGILQGDHLAAATSSKWAGPTPSRYGLYRCGRFEVLLPRDLVPEDCVPLGLESDEGEQEGEQVICQTSDLFPEMASTEVRANTGAVEVAGLALTRLGDAPSQGPAANVDCSRAPPPPSNYSSLCDVMVSYRVKADGTAFDIRPARSTNIWDPTDPVLFRIARDWLARCPQKQPPRGRSRVVRRIILARDLP